jgi:hypothetical protein
LGGDVSGLSERGIGSRPKWKRGGRGLAVAIARVVRQRRRGEMPDEEILDAIERWHGGAAPGTELYEYLGMTWDEYAVWVEGGSANEKERPEGRP